jgi:Leucine-rich repeat (LRR) protein
MELDLTNSNLETFPHLSGFEYKKVNASSNSIMVLWDEHMPRGIEELNLDENRLGTDGLLIEWPNTIKSLSLAYNPYRLLDIVARWPTALRVLNLSNTNLMEVPTNLPPALEVLNVSHTFIKRIGLLPEGLKELYVNSTELKFLPKRLPPSLEILHAANNSLRNGGLSLIWGSSLKFLDLNYNHLTQPPRRLPDTIEHLNLSGNYIRSISSEVNFPESLKVLHLGHNRIFELPTWLVDRHQLRFTIQRNLLVKPVDAVNCIIWISQLIGPSFTSSAYIIQRGWRLYRMRRRLSAWRKNSVLRDELLALAMHPDRAGRYEDISSEWRRA